MISFKKKCSRTRTHTKYQKASLIPLVSTKYTSKLIERNEAETTYTGIKLKSAILFSISLMMVEMFQNSYAL